MVGTEVAMTTYGEPSQWMNVCQFLTERNHRLFFPRGYGMAARHRLADGATPVGNTSQLVAVNAGLWLGDPDIDATTRLALPIDATGYQREDN